MHTESYTRQRLVYHTLTNVMQRPPVQKGAAPPPARDADAMGIPDASETDIPDGSDEADSESPRTMVSNARSGVGAGAVTFGQ